MLALLHEFQQCSGLTWADWQLLYCSSQVCAVQIEEETWLLVGTLQVVNTISLIHQTQPKLLHKTGTQFFQAGTQFFQPEELSTSFFWRRPLMEVETSSFKL